MKHNGSLDHCLTWFVKFSFFDKQRENYRKKKTEERTFLICSQTDFKHNNKKSLKYSCDLIAY